MKREEAIQNAIGILIYSETKKTGYIRNIMSNDYEISLVIHFSKLSEEVYEAKKAITPLLLDGTTIEVHSYPEKGFETLDITWDIK